MATDGPDPPPCSDEILKEGTPVMATHSITSNGMELYVKMIAYVSGQPVDWHYVGGRARVLTTGDPAAVTQAIWDLMPLHDLLVRNARKRGGLLGDLPVHQPMIFEPAV